MSERASWRLRRLASQLVTAPVAGPGDELVPAAASIQLTDEDVQRLTEKYALERDMRLDHRPEGNSQYIRLHDLAQSDERFKRMIEDPYPWGPGGQPAPLTDEVEVCIVGAGYGGLSAGARLVMEGVDPKDIRLVDKSRDVGGTWYWNRYPGAMCDIESYVYMPLCEELGYVPTMKYAKQPEIYAHSQLIAKTYGLYGNACFGAAVTEMRWEEERGLWAISTSRGDRFRARYVIMNFGTFVHPKLPGVPGIEKFEGHVFHTSRFDYAYTGGSSEGGLDKLGDKRVGIVGTGATAIQVVPHLGETAKQLYVFQRTPSSVDMRNNCETTDEFARSFLSKPGWQRERQDNFYFMTQTRDGAKEDLINDGWTDIIRNLLIKSTGLVKQKVAEARAAGKEPDMPSIRKEAARVRRIVELQQMEKIRRRAEIVVKDPTTAEGLKPWYDQFCKRPCFHDDYLATFNLPNVELVHTGGLGIDRFTPKGVVANGVEYEIDCLVLATGFENSFSESMSGLRNIGYEIYGMDGLALSEKWASPQHRYGPGPKTYRSLNSAGFPNLFMQNAPQGVFTTNFTYQLGENAMHIAHIIRRMQEAGYKRFDVKPEEEEKYLDLMWKESPISKGERPACTPGYFNQEGKVGKKGERVLGGAYPGGAKKFFEQCEKERKAGHALDCFNLS